MGGTPLNTPDPQKLLQALLAMRQGQGMQPGNMSGIPGAAPQGQAPPQQAQAQPQTQAQPQAQAPQSGPTRHLSPLPPQQPFQGTFGDMRGIIPSLVDSAQKRKHDKKVNEAMMYYNQIQSFLDAGDEKNAHALVDDPKVLKILDTALGYKPLEEEPPPEAIGVAKARQQIQQKQSMKQKLQQMLTGGQRQNAQPPPPHGRVIIPGPSQAAQGQYAEQQAKIQEQQSLAKLHDTEGDADKIKAAASQQRADAATEAAKLEAIRVESERIKNLGSAEEAKSHAKVFEQQAKDATDISPMKQNEAQAHANEMNGMTAYHLAMAKWAKNGKLPSSKVADLMKGQRADITNEIKAYRTDNTEAMKEMAKNPWYRSDSRLQKLQDDAGKKAKALAAALAWYDGEGMQLVLDGKKTPPEVYAMAHKMAGIDPPPTLDPNDNTPSGITVNTPSGLMTFPDQASADAFKKEAGIP
jgi:hypothetical protein